MSKLVKCPRCSGWLLHNHYEFDGKKVIKTSIVCFLCGGERHVEKELDAAYKLLHTTLGDYPGSLQIDMPTIVTLYHSGLLPKSAHALIHHFIKENRIEDAIRSEGLKIVREEPGFLDLDV